MKDILILGGAGYIGSYITKKLLINNFNPVIVDNLSTGNNKNIFANDFYKIDISDKIALTQIFKKHRIQCVIHLAQNLNTDDSITNPQKYYKNILNVLTILDCMLENNVKNIVFSSSGKIFGKPQYLPINEIHPRQPITPTGKISLTIENILEDYEKAYNIKSICLRLFNVAGTDKSSKIKDKKTNLIKNIFNVIDKETEFLKVYGDGETERDYTHVKDVAEAFVLATEKLLNTKQSDRINISAGNSVSINEIIKITEKLTGKEVPVLFSDARFFDYKEFSVSNSYAQESLFWIPKYRNIEEIIKTYQ